ncbi:hypothetical protein [Serinicoccus kebangsaanensis]|uniref:hypothetical protein n=1 Tax=Serinicoccus kebangsaanensis TaxID=2602069 RepID=UPI00124D2ACC|nr:hypothetical protein [Serinicoccus kebangsaanensis]
MNPTPTTPPSPNGATTALIDCETCPVRGRHCGDCFVPVLGRIWLQDPVRSAPAEPGTRSEPEAEHRPVGPEEDVTAALDSDELAAVSAFVRAGLVAPEDADAARAVVQRPRRATG